MSLKRAVSPPLKGVRRCRDTSAPSRRCAGAFFFFDGVGCGAARGRFFGLVGVGGGGRAAAGRGALPSSTSFAWLTAFIASVASSAVSAPRTLSGCSASDRSLHAVWTSLGLAPGSSSSTSSGLPAAEARMTLL